MAVVALITIDYRAAAAKAPFATFEPEHRSRINRFLLNVQSALGLESAAAAAHQAHLSLSDVLIGTLDTVQASITR